jgi:hypothetical protein
LGLSGFWKRVTGRLEPIFQSDSEFIDGAFRDILGRHADQEGLGHYRRALREGRSRTWVLIDIMRSEEFRRSLPVISSSLPNLVVQRPEKYRRVIDRTNGNSILTVEAASPEDLDWLETAIIANGYYEKPGVWVLEVNFDKRLVAEMLASFAPAASLELGCASGAVLQCLDEVGIAGEGVEISSMAIAKAADTVRPRIHQGDLLALDLPRKYDLLFGLDIFEHLNPNKLHTYVQRIAEVTTDDAYLFCNIPAFGADPLFGTVFPFYVDGWTEDAAAGRAFRSLHTDEEGYPLHGHLAWADAPWWTARFEQAGFIRDVDVERAFHAKYDGYMEKRSPARRAYFVFGKKKTAARRAAVVERIGVPSKLL